MKPKAILFDINETVLDLSTLRPKFDHYFANSQLTDLWFSMLLHSSTVCLATGVKSTFARLAENALHCLAGKQQRHLKEADIKDILSTFATLTPHKDVIAGWLTLKDAGFKLVALSNSSQALLTSQLSNAALERYLDAIISVEQANTFKPDKQAYMYAAKNLALKPEEMLLVACHDWDTHGAMSAGLQAAFINRSGAPYHRLYQKPMISGLDMLDVAEQIIALN